jgi:hypothetical protein
MLNMVVHIVTTGLLRVNIEDVPWGEKSLSTHSCKTCCSDDLAWTPVVTHNERPPAITTPCLSVRSFWQNGRLLKSLLLEKLTDMSHGGLLQKAVDDTHSDVE